MQSRYRPICKIDIMKMYGYVCSVVGDFAGDWSMGEMSVVLRSREVHLTWSIVAVLYLDGLLGNMCKPSFR